MEKELDLTGFTTEQKNEIMEMVEFLDDMFDIDIHAIQFPEENYVDFLDENGEILIHHKRDTVLSF